MKAFGSPLRRAAEDCETYRQQVERVLELADGLSEGQRDKVYEATVRESQSRRSTMAKPGRSSSGYVDCWMAPSRLTRTV